MIEHYTFGSFVIEGKRYESNVVLMGEEVREGRYLPGHDLRMEDIKPLVDSGAEVIIIGTGTYGAVEVKEEIKEMVKGAGRELIIEKTGRACEIYNDLIKKGKKVAGFLHNTC